MLISMHREAATMKSKLEIWVLTGVAVTFLSFTLPVYLGQFASDIFHSLASLGLATTLLVSHRLFCKTLIKNIIRIIGGGFAGVFVVCLSDLICGDCIKTNTPISIIYGVVIMAVIIVLIIKFTAKIWK